MNLEKELISIKERLINVAFIAAAVYVTPALIGSLIRFVEIGWHKLFLIQSILGLLVVGVALFREKVPVIIKVHLFGMVMHAIAFLGFYYLGISGGWYFVLISLIVVTLILGRKIGLYYFFAAIVGFLIVYLIQQSGIYVNEFNIQNYLNNKTSYINTATGFLFSSFILIYVGGTFYSLFTDYISKLFKNSKELESTFEKLQNSEERFRTFLENNPFPISIKDENKKFIYINKAINETIDEKHANSEYESTRDMFSLEIVKELDKADDYVLNTGNVFVKDTKGLIDEAWQYYRIVKFPLHDSNQKMFVGTIAIRTTEQKVAEKMMADSERKFRSMFNGSVNGIVFTDSKGDIMDCNPSFLKMTGYKLNEIFGEPILDFLPENSKERLHSYIQDGAINAGDHSGIFENEIINKYGNKIPIEIDTYKLMLNEEDFFWHMIRDITLQKTIDLKLYKAMVESEERERERYAKELHDGLGPILSTCMIYVNSLSQIEDEKKQTEFIDRSLDLLKDAVQNIKEISNNLSPVVLQSYGLEHAIKAFIAKLVDISGVEFSISSNLEKRLSDLIEITLYRTLTELINNSIKYAEASLIKIIIDYSGEQLQIQYSDNGKGFDIEEIKRKGSGFGLLNMENRIDKIGGKYQFVTELQKGVEVSMRIDNVFL